jgi:hypothetical protein
MIELTILVPKRRNTDGQAHLPDAWRSWERYLSDVFGGWTRGGDVQGCWHGKLEVSREYRVATDRLDLLPVLVRYVKDLFDQETVYVARREAEIL